VSGADAEVTVGNRIRLGFFALALAAVAATAAACGGGGKPAANAAPSGRPSGQGGGQAYVACLRDHGVDLPQFNGSRGPRPSGRPSGRPTARPSDGGNSGGFRGGFGDQPPPGVDAQTWQKAQQACASLRSSAGPQRDNGAFQAYRNCLADHGVTMSGRPDQLATTDPKVAEALRICQPLRPTTRPSPTPSG
jgi:hypothetical protein